MSDKSILFSGSMIRALLEDRKTQTRRLMKPQPLDLRSPPHPGESDAFAMIRRDIDNNWEPLYCPYGKPGDLLWVKETWTLGSDGSDAAAYTWPIYAAAYSADAREYAEFKPWNSSRFMPRKYSRLTLELIEVRVQMLQDISDADAIAEGIVCTEFWREEHPPHICFSVLWDSINGKESWNANPWIWAISFKTHQKNINVFMEERAAA